MGRQNFVNRFMVFPQIKIKMLFESVVAYVHWLLLCSRNVVTSKVAASDGFIPSDNAIDELFPKLWRLIPH